MLHRSPLTAHGLPDVSPQHLTHAPVCHASHLLVGFVWISRIREELPIMLSARDPPKKGVLPCGRSLSWRCCWPAGLHPSVHSTPAMSRSVRTVATRDTTVASS